MQGSAYVLKQPVKSAKQMCCSWRVQGKPLHPSCGFMFTHSVALAMLSSTVPAAFGCALCSVQAGLPS
jgi:hypothetical protein